MTDVSTLTKDEIPELRNIPVYTAEGEEIGHVGDAYYDEDSGQLRCVGIAADGLGFARRMVPVQGATLDERGLHLPYASGDVQGSPEVDRDLDEDLYAQVSNHYAKTEAGGSIVRSEEELQVGTREVEAGSVRLRKWVETEPVEAEVELERESATIERVPLNEPVSDAEIGDAEVEVTLRAEEPVVEKQTVAKEQINVGKQVETERTTVSDEVRKERVDVDDDVR